MMDEEYPLISILKQGYLLLKLFTQYYMQEVNLAAVDTRYLEDFMALVLR